LGVLSQDGGGYSKQFTFISPDDKNGERHQYFTKYCSLKPEGSCRYHVLLFY